MADQVASLVVEVDASGAKKAAVDLDTLAKAADRADNAANDLADSSRKLSAAEQTVANEAKRAMEGMNHLAVEQEAVRRTSERLNQAHGTTIKNTAALNQATLNLGRQFTDIGVQLAGGQSPFLILIQQAPQVADALAMAKTQGVGLKAIIVETTVAARGLLVTFAPWIAGLAAIGGAAFLVYDAYQKQAKAIEDTTNRLKEQDKALGQISPLLSQAKTNADLAADGQRNFDEWIRKTNVSLGEQIRLQRAAALNQTNEAALKAGENLRKAQEEFDRVNRPGARSGFSTGVGGFSTISAGGAINKESELYKKAAANLKTAQADLDAVMKRLAQQGQAPDVAFGAQTESVNRATTAVRSATTATEDYRRAAAINEADLLVAAKVVWPEAAAAAEAYEKQQKSLTVVANDNIRTFEEATKGQIRFSDRLEIAAFELARAAEEARNLRYDIEDIAYAINRNDWTSAFAGLVNVLANVEKAFKSATTAKEKYSAVAMLAQGVGSAIGGTGGAVIGGAGSGALAGLSAGSALTTLGLAIPGPGWALAAGGAVLGAIGGLFGSSKAKKQQKAQEAAQRAAEEAARQQQINDATFGLNVALLEAQGKAEEALAMTRQRELDALAKLDPSLVALQQQLYAAEDAASAAAKEAEAQAQALQKEIAVRQTQRGIMLQLMALDDAVTGGNSAVLAARQDELAALDPVSRQLKDIYYARLDEGEALAKQAAAMEKAAEAARAYQETNIGLMRQLMAMDDAVLGTTSARDAARADELAKLDETGRKLQTIIWARQDEAEVIAKQQAATEAATAAAEESARKTAEILKQRTDLENQLLVALGMTALATERQRTAMLESLDPSLRGYQTLLYGVEDATAAVTAAESALADARSAASQAYEREASALQATIDKFKSFSATFKSIGASLTTGPMAALNPTQLYARTQADFARVADRIAMGDTEALGDVQSVIEANLAASEKAQATNVGYLKDVSAAKRLQEAALKLSDKQVDQGSAQLAALQSQVSALGILNQSTLSVGQAVTNVAAAIDALTRATSAKLAAEAAAKQALSSAGVIPKATESLNDTSRQVLISANDNAALAAAKVYYNSANGGVDSALFNRYFANDPFGKSVGFTGDPEELRKRYGFATGGSFTVGGSGPPDSQVFPLHLSPGEMVNVSRPGQGGNAELVAELRALRQEVADLRAHTKRGADAAQDSALVLDGVARGQLTFTTEAA